MSSDLPDPNDPIYSDYEKAAKAGVGASIGLIIFIVLLGILSIVGLIRLFVHWNRFGDRAVPMLLVTIFIPFGFLWPLLATPYVYTKYGLMSKRQAIMMDAQNRKGKNAPLYY